VADYAAAMQKLAARALRPAELYADGAPTPVETELQRRWGASFLASPSADLVDFRGMIDYQATYLAIQHKAASAFSPTVRALLERQVADMVAKLGVQDMPRGRLDVACAVYGCEPVLMAMPGIGADPFQEQMPSLEDGASALLQLYPCQ
jgi:hypothetical protein